MANSHNVSCYTCPGASLRALPQTVRPTEPTHEKRPMHDTHIRLTHAFLTCLPGHGPRSRLTVALHAGSTFDSGLEGRYSTSTLTVIRPRRRAILYAMLLVGGLHL